MQGFTITAEEFEEYKTLKQSAARPDQQNETMQAAVRAVNGNARMIQAAPAPDVLPREELIRQLGFYYEHVTVLPGTLQAW